MCLETSMNKNIFIDSQIEANFRREGYVLLPAIDKQNLQELSRFFKENDNPSLTGFQSSHFLKDRDLKRAIHQEIVKAYSPRLNEAIEHYQMVFGNFMVKYPGENSIMPLHADWTYVNEEKEVSLGIWSPLVDTDDNNGKIGVVPKSHLFKKHKRGPQIPSLFNEHNEYIIDNYGKKLSLKAGEVLVYDHRLLHFSGPNQSSNVRPAINLVMCPKQSNIYHYAKHGANKSITMYQVEDLSFFMDYEHFEIPDSLTKTKELTLNSKAFNKEEIDQVLQQKQEFGLLSYLKNIFKK